VLPNGIEPDEYAIDRAAARAEVERTWPELEGAPFILFLARLHPKKRLDLLLEAFLSGAPASFKLLVAGPDEAGLWEPLARRFLREEHAARRVVRLGTVAGRQKLALLAAAKLFALPSEHENFGIAPLEALAAGTPALLSPHVDLAASACSAGVAFAAPLQVGAWRQRLGELLANPGSLSALAGAARSLVRVHYAWQRLSGLLLERYRWVALGCPPGDPAPCCHTLTSVV
jgi:glycosyltransferase involved in cell wall biosynthesis